METITLSKAEGLALAAEWMASGLSQAAFAQQKGVHKARISYWHQKMVAKHTGAGMTAQTFTELPHGLYPGCPEKSCGDITISFASGIRVQLPGNSDLKQVLTLVASL